MTGTEGESRKESEEITFQVKSEGEGVGRKLLQSEGLAWARILTQETDRYFWEDPRGSSANHSEKEWKGGKKWEKQVGTNWCVVLQVLVRNLNFIQSAKETDEILSEGSDTISKRLLRPVSEKLIVYESSGNEETSTRAMRTIRRGLSKICQTQLMEF